MTDDMDALKKKWFGGGDTGLTIKKEYQVTTGQLKGRESVETITCNLRAGKLDTSLKTLTALFNEAKKDFPDLKEEDITLTVFENHGGAPREIARGPVGYDGIQFEVKTTPPETYRKLRPSGWAQG